MPNELEASWVEKDMAGGEIVNALVLIMRTNGCCWAKSGSGGCTMCGYRTASLSGVTEEDLNAQIDQALAKYKGEPFVKIYTSGSFFDPEEIPVPVRERVFREFAGCRRLLVESRPEFITDELAASLPKNITVALGLESSNEEILRASINKGFTAAQSKAAGERLKAAGLMVRSPRSCPRRLAWTTLCRPSASPTHSPTRSPSTPSTSSTGPTSRGCGREGTSDPRGYGP